MTTNTDHAFASTNQNGIDSREDPSREAETRTISASLLSILIIMARNQINIISEQLDNLETFLLRERLT